MKLSLSCHRGREVKCDDTLSTPLLLGDNGGIILGYLHSLNTSKAAVHPVIDIMWTLFSISNVVEHLAHPIAYIVKLSLSFDRWSVSNWVFTYNIVENAFMPKVAMIILKTPNISLGWMYICYTLRRLALLWQRNFKIYCSRSVLNVHFRSLGSSFCFWFFMGSDSIGHVVATELKINELIYYGVVNPSCHRLP